MYHRLSFDHPHAWHSALPPKRWDSKNKKYVFPPKSPDAIADAYERYLLGKLAAHALRFLNGQWEPDEDALATLSHDLEVHAIAAGGRVGVSFSAGRATASRTIAGQLSLTWLRRAVRKAVTFSMDSWDPAVARQRREAAIRGGQSSHRGPKFTVAELPAGSIKAQMEALNCSRATVRRLRRKQRESAL